MENKFNQLVLTFTTSLSTDILREIINILEQQTNESLSSFITESCESLVILKNWSWQIFSEGFVEVIYEEFFLTFASFHRKMIYHYENISVDTKALLLFPESIQQIDTIFQKIHQNYDDNQPYLVIISSWFDNHSHFLFDNTQYNVSSVIDHIGQYIFHNYLMSEQYKLYLNQLRQSDISQSIFTHKMLFYISTCSFYADAYVITKMPHFSYSADELTSYLRDDYLQIMHIHSHTVAVWSKELLGCVTQLIGLIGRCCWWDGIKRTQIKVLLPTEQITCDYIQDLVRIVGYKPLYKQTKSVRSNNETILMDSAFISLLIIIQTLDISWFFRSNILIRDTIVSAAEASLNDEVSLCGYAVLGEALPDEDLKALQVSDNISDFFFTMLEEAWHGSSKKYKHIPVTYLLKGFQNLSKNDCMQQRAVKLNKIPLFIEMCDEHPIVFDILWAFSFNQGIQQQLRSNSMFMSKLSHLAKECNDKQTRKTIHGILWNLEIDHQDRPTDDTDDTKSFDIMISYSHKEKTLCQQIYEELTKVGYRVWIDYDQMHGNVMDAMAQAIEQSHTVIICMSEAYRKSNYCRAEAHYAFQRQRKIVPVLLQKHYKPDGWLLFLIGQLLYVDFNKHEFNRAMTMLFNELKVDDNSSTNMLPMHPKEDTPVQISITSTLQSKTSPSSASNVIEWTQTEVQQWLIEHNLVQMSQLVADCDGRSLVYLHKYMKQGQTQQVLNLLQEDCLRRTKQNLSLIELSRFHSLMDRQKNVIQSKTGK